MDYQVFQDEIKEQKGKYLVFCQFLKILNILKKYFEILS